MYFVLFAFHFNYWKNKYSSIYLLTKQISHCTYAYSGSSSVDGIATGYGLDGPGIEFRWGARISRPVQTGPGAHPMSSTMGTGSFLGVKSGRGVILKHYPLLVSWSWNSRAIPLLPLWAVRLVQSLSACTRVTFTFTYAYIFSLLFIMFRLWSNVLNKRIEC
jgi:hypothetical protein